jgi:acetylglutamate kinase
MVDGRRITDAAMLDVVTMVYGGLVNKKIVARLQSMGMNAIGLTGADLSYMLSDKRPVKTVDYGFVGDVKQVDANALGRLIDTGAIPVLAPLTHDGKGNLLNTNADTIAGEAAKALATMYEVTLTYCFEKKGVMRDQEDENSVIPVITPALYEELKSDGIIVDGMIPKIDNAFAALAAGVNQVRITRADDLEGGTVIVNH